MAMSIVAELADIPRNVREHGAAAPTAQTSVGAGDDSRTTATARLRRRARERRPGHGVRALPPRWPYIGRTARSLVVSSRCTTTTRLRADVGYDYDDDEILPRGRTRHSQSYTRYRPYSKTGNREYNLNLLIQLPTQSYNFNIRHVVYSYYIVACILLLVGLLVWDYIG